MAAFGPIALAALLTLVVAADLTRRRVPNALSVALAASGLVVQAFAGPRAIAFALIAIAVTFAAGALAWRAHLFGGGDAKLAAACAAWVGLDGLPRYLLAAALVGGAVSLVCYAASARAERRAIRANLLVTLVPGAPSLPVAPGPRRTSVPYAVAIASGALYAVLGA